MIIDPAQYESTSVRELLDAAEKGIVPFDHRLLHRLLDRPEGVLDEILAFASDSGDEELMIEEELFAVFQHLQDPRCLPWVVGRLRRSPDAFEEEAIDCLRQFGSEAVPPLLEWFAEDSEAGFFLAAANPGDSRVLNALLAHLDSDVSGAAFCLTVFGDPAAIPRIEQSLAATADPEARHELEAALRELRDRGPEPPPKPYNIWDDFPEEALPDFYAFKDEELVEFLASPEAAYRTGALEMLSRPRLERAHADKVLALAESDPEPAVRGKAWEVLGDRWEQRAIQSKILARLRDAEAPPVERAGALVAAAGPLGDRAEIQDLIQRFYDEEATRLQAMRAIVFSGEPKFAPVVLDNLQAADPSLVREAIQGVGSLQLAEGAPDLVPFFESHTDRVLALEAYAMSAPAQLTRKGMRQLLDKMERLAGGFEDAELEAVTEALNLRLERADLEPLFDEKGEMIPAPLEIVRRKTGRNDPCPCGSGKKYKKCCGA